MKVAYFSPLPPDTSGIADYSALLLPALGRLVDVQAVRPGRTRPPADADIAVYHVGNNPDAHGWIVDALRRRPGVVVLHEFVLHHLVAGLTIGRKDGHAYLAAMEREAGVPGRLLGYGVLEGRVPPLWEVRPDEFPLAGEVLDRATGLIVHSGHVAARAREAGYDGPLWTIPHPAWPVPAVEPARIDGSPVFGCFGHLNESKRIPQLLEAFARARRRFQDARLLLVGASSPGFDLDGRLERLGLDREGVQREDYVEEARLWSLMAACDALVALRSPTMGETSGTAIRGLSLGKPLVVSDVGWFAELPDEVALKVPAGGPDEVDALAAALERLADDPAERERRGAAARELAEREHELGRVAELYAAALEEAAGGAMVEARVLEEVAAAAATTGVEPDLVAPLLAGAGLATNGHRAQPEPRGPRAPWLRAVPNGVWLAAIVVVSAVVQFLLAQRVVSPWIMVDELVYSDMARSFAATGHFLIRGEHASYGVVYPAILSVAYRLFDSMPSVYTAAKAINAPLISLAAIPAYFLARRVLRPPAALAAAALAVALPSLAYAGTLMTENAFYPLFLCVALALVAMLERPTWGRQLLVLGLCALAFLTRAQAVALFAAALSAPLALAWIERGRPRRLRAFAPLYGVTILGALVVVTVELARGHSPAAALGSYSQTGSASYRAWPAFEWLVYHIAELDLALFVLPFAALIVVVATARHSDPALRAFAAGAATLSGWLILEVAIFASHYSQRIEERNLFYVMPLFLVALLAWIQRGQPRPPRVTVIAALLAAALPGAIPFAALLTGNVTSESDTVGLRPWWYVENALVGSSSAQIVPVLTAIALALAFLYLPRRHAPWLPVLVAAGFLATWLPLQLWDYSFRSASIGAWFQGIGPDTPKTWIDDTVGHDADVAAIWTNRGNPFTIQENEFWNRSVGRVYDLGPPIGGDMPEPALELDKATGQLRLGGRAISPEYVLTDSSLQLAGTVVARDEFRTMQLVRLRGPLRLTTRIVGQYPGDTWSGPRLEWIRSDCAGGTLTVVLRTDTTLFPGGQRIVVGGTAPAQTIRLSKQTPRRTVRLPLAAAGGSCSATFSISPARVPGKGDNRLLGTHFDSFSFAAKQ